MLYSLRTHALSTRSARSTDRSFVLLIALFVLPISLFVQPIVLLDGTSKSAKTRAQDRNLCDCRSAHAYYLTRLEIEQQRFHYHHSNDALISSRHPRRRSCHLLLLQVTALLSYSLSYSSFDPLFELLHYPAHYRPHYLGHYLIALAILLRSFANHCEVLRLTHVSLPLLQTSSAVSEPF